MSPRTVALLRGETEAFCAATSLVSQTGSLIELFSAIWLQRSERAFEASLAAGWACWSKTMACAHVFSRDGSRCSVRSIPFPSSRKQAFPPSMRCSGRLRAAFSSVGCLRPAQDEDTARLFAAVFCSSRAVQRFLDMDAGAVCPPGRKSLERGRPRCLSPSTPGPPRSATIVGGARFGAWHQPCSPPAQRRSGGGAISFLRPGLCYRTIH